MYIRKNISIIILSFSIFLIACTTSKKVSVDQKISQIETPKETNPVDLHKLIWIPNSNVSMADTSFTKRPIPKKYKIYTLDSHNLQSWIQDLKQNNKTGFITIPINGIDETFTLEDAKTMSPVLAAKFPQILSLKGFHTKDPQSNIRLNINEQELDIQVQIKDKTYIISKWEQPNFSGYLIYDKNDSNEEKLDFENANRKK